MSKYFKEREKIQLSKYLDKDISESSMETVDYLMSCLGDVSLPVDIIEAYDGYFHSSGGRYSVRGEVETVQGLYDFYKKFPKLSKEAFDEISFIYIKDLFEEYALDETFEKLIKVYGETEDALDMFITYTEKKADKLQEKYEKEATKLDQYAELYHVDGLVDDYIPYLKSLVTRQHISVDKIIESMPAAELVQADRKQLYEIELMTRSFMGCGYPVSYIMTEVMAKDEDLSRFGEQPSYYISLGDRRVEATFSTQDFVDSVKKGKSLVKEK